LHGGACPCCSKTFVAAAPAGLEAGSPLCRWSFFSDAALFPMQPVGGRIAGWPSSPIGIGSG
jgi:hypothetical protein